MVSFRKMSMAFAGCMLAGIGIASAQTKPVTCTVSATSPAIRLEGLTEPIGVVSLDCATLAGADATPALLATIQIATDGPQFTGLLANKDTRVVSGVTIHVRGGANLLQGADNHAAQGVLAADGKSITFNLVKMAPFYGADAQAAILDIAGLRINAQQSQGNLTNPKVTVTAATYNNLDTKTIVIKEGTQPVGTVQTAVNFSSKKAVANLNCQAYDPAGSFTAAQRKALAKVTFAGTFPGSIDETTPLTARFTVPKGAKLFVGTANIDTDGAFIAAAGKPLATSFEMPADPADYAPGFVEVEADSKGIYEFSWTIQTPDSGTDSYSFPLYITIPDNFIMANSLTATGSIGPFSAVTSATADADIDQPRYVLPTHYSDALVGIDSCTTVLLFPYVTSKDNWETGVVIANTTSDMKDDQGNWASGNEDEAKNGQNGTCTLYYVGVNAPAKAIKSAAINAGDTVAFLASAGDTAHGIAGVGTDFSGYLKVSCSFSHGKGFAFLFSPDMGGVGVGYNAHDNGNGDVVLVP